MDGEDDPGPGIVNIGKCRVSAGEISDRLRALLCQQAFEQLPPVYDVGSIG